MSPPSSLAAARHVPIMGATTARKQCNHNPVLQGGVVWLRHGRTRATTSRNVWSLAEELRPPVQPIAYPAGLGTISGGKNLVTPRLRGRIGSLVGTTRLQVGSVIALSHGRYMFWAARARGHSHVISNIPLQQASLLNGQLRNKRNKS